MPTIAAWNGSTVGAGAGLALACDLDATASARFSVPFTRLGISPGMATALLPEVVGIAAARDLLLTGRALDAQEMLRLGLVSSVSGDDGFLDGVLRLAHTIAAAAPVAVRLSKAALAGGAPAEHRDGARVGGARAVGHARNQGRPRGLRGDARAAGAEVHRSVMTRRPRPGLRPPPTP